MLSAAEAKKLGIKVAEKVPEKIHDKATKAAKTAPAENGKKEDKASVKLPTAPKQPTINKQPGKKGKDDDETDDPIAKSLKEREKAGSITSTVDKKADAKKTHGATPKVGTTKAKEDKKQLEAKLPATKEKELKDKKDHDAKATETKKKDVKATPDASKVATT